MAQGKAVDKSTIVRILVTAAMFGDERAVADFHISDRTLRRYRQDAREDAEMAELIRYSLEQSGYYDWERDLGRTMVEILSAQRSVCESLKEDPTPEALQAINESAQVVGDLVVASQMINARLNSQANGAEATPVGQMVASSIATRQRGVA